MISQIYYKFIHAWLLLLLNESLLSIENIASKHRMHLENDSEVKFIVPLTEFFFFGNICTKEHTLKYTVSILEKVTYFF